jgi:hypothetical protein
MQAVSFSTYYCAQSLDIILHIYVNVCCRSMALLFCVTGISATVTLCVINLHAFLTLLSSHCVLSYIIFRATSYLVNKRFVYYNYILGSSVLVTTY